MWLSEKMATRETPVSGAEEGVISVGGTSPAVVTDGEKRHTAVISPGGYFWNPGVEEKVAVFGGDDCYILGRLQQGDLLPGEIRICTGGASVRLLPNGDVHIDGTIYLNGERWQGNDHSSIT